MGVITGVHTLVYADDAEAARAFLRDVLGWPYVDARGGWLIFGTGPSELAVHPTRQEGGEPGRHHEIALLCEDVDAAVAELTARGATFTRGVDERSWGRTTALAVPGAGEIMLYQPKHPLAAR
jgi:catechol 2,3-dioxygenase-like lactoylglutathione lyase family enzyme